METGASEDCLCELGGLCGPEYARLRRSGGSESRV